METRLNVFEKGLKALNALMCFHASRFDAREIESGEMILYHEQDDSLWDEILIKKGTHYLIVHQPGISLQISLGGGYCILAFVKTGFTGKVANILDLYNHLLILEYSPIAALNRTFALSKTHGKKEAIIEAEKLKLTDNRFYFTLLGNLYTNINTHVALQNF